MDENGVIQWFTLLTPTLNCFSCFFQGSIVQGIIIYYVPYYSSMKIVFRAQSIPVYLFRQPRRQLIVRVAIACNCHRTGLFLGCYLCRSGCKLLRSQKLREASEAMQVVRFFFIFKTDKMWNYCLEIYFYLDITLLFVNNQIYHFYIIL